MVQLSVKALALAFVASLVPNVACKATWADIAPPNRAAASSLTSLSQAIDAFPATGGTLSQALAISADAASASKAFDAATSTINSTLLAVGPPNDTDATDGCPENQLVAGGVLKVLSSLETKKAAFASAANGAALGLIKQQIVRLNTSAAAFNNAWLFIAPPNFRAAPESYKAQVDNAFKDVASAYASTS